MRPFQLLAAVASTICRHPFPCVFQQLLPHGTGCPATILSKLEISILTSQYVRLYRGNRAEITCLMSGNQ